jgi:hypothetical protein
VEQGLAADLAEVVRRELALLQPDVRANPDAVLWLLHPSFVEVGASGRAWDAESIAARLAADADSTPIDASELHPVALAPNVVLLTYIARKDGRGSRRVSVWLRDEDEWLLRYHQGTSVPDPEG